MKTLVFFSLLLLTNFLFPQAPTWSWLQTGSGPGNDHPGSYFDPSASAIVTDPLGYSYVTGTFTGQANFGTVSVNSGSTQTVFLAKYDQQGNCVWLKNFGGDKFPYYASEGTAVCLDNAGNCYLTGHLYVNSSQTVAVGSLNFVGTGERQIYLVKFDPGGNPLWISQSTSTNTGSCYATKVVTDKSGNCYVSGFVDAGTIVIGSTPPLTGTGPFLVKFDSFGTALWAKSVGMMASGVDIAVDKAGNVLMTGDLQGTGVYPTTPPTSITVKGSRDVFAAKFSPAGQYLWIKNFGGVNPSTVWGSAWAFGKAIDTDSLGNYYITGDFAGRLEIGGDTLFAPVSFSPHTFITKLDPLGSPLWALQSVPSATNGFSESIGSSIKVLSDGSFFITGYYSRTSSESLSFGNLVLPHVAGSDNIYVGHFDSSGNVIWLNNTSGGDMSYCLPAGISTDGANNVYIVAKGQGTVVAGTYSASTMWDSYVTVAKLGNALLPTELSSSNYEKGLQIFPNPFQHSLSVDLGEGFSKGSVLTLFNNLGQQVFQSEIHYGMNVFDTKSFIQGVYIYSVSSDLKVTRGKIVRE